MVENAAESFGTKVFDVEPLTIGPVVSDVIVDLEVAYENVHRAKSYIIRPSPGAAASRRLAVSLKWTNTPAK